MFPTFSFYLSFFAISGLWGSIQLGVNQRIWHYQPFCLAENIHAIITYTPKNIVGLNISKKFTMLKIISKLFQFRQQRWIFALTWVNILTTIKLLFAIYKTRLFSKRAFAFCLNQFHSFQYFPSFSYTFCLPVVGRPSFKSQIRY